MRGRITASAPSPALVVASLALVAAVAGTAVAADPIAGPAKKKKLTKKKVERISRKQANKQITKRAPELAVGSAQSAANATNATNATNAANAINAQALGGNPPSAFERAGRITAGSAATNAPGAVGIRVLRDPNTGADVRVGSNDGQVRVVNTSSSRRMTAAGVSSFTTGNPEREFATLMPGAQQDFAWSTFGPKYLSLFLTLQGPTGATTRRSQLTCSVSDAGGGPAILSCVAVG